MSPVDDHDRGRLCSRLRELRAAGPPTPAAMVSITSAGSTAALGPSSAAYASSSAPTTLPSCAETALPPRRSNTGYAFALPDGTVNHASLATPGQALRKLYEDGPLNGSLVSGQAISCSLVYFSEADAGPVTTRTNNGTAITARTASPRRLAWVVAASHVWIPAVIGSIAADTPKSAIPTGAWEVLEYFADAKTGTYIEAISFPEQGSQPAGSHRDTADSTTSALPATGPATQVLRLALALLYILGQQPLRDVWCGKRLSERILMAKRACPCACTS